MIARDLYPEYVNALVARTGRHVSLDRAGVLELAGDETEAMALQGRMRAGSSWIDSATLRGLEPSLAPVVGAAFHPLDGSVNVAELLDAVVVDAEREPRIVSSVGRVVRVSASERPLAAILESGERFEADMIVLAAGAWVGLIQGIPRWIPVVPVRGQILVFDNPGLRHVVMGPRGYLVGRRNQSLAGSTMEHVGFDAGTTDSGAAEIHAMAAGLSPSFAAIVPIAHWAGLRPVTPDLLPMVGRDPDCEGLLYACGHSKNGVLLAPLTARVIADLVAHGSSGIDVAPYAPARFGETGR